MLWIIPDPKHLPVNHSNIPLPHNNLTAPYFPFLSPSNLYNMNQYKHFWVSFSIQGGAEWKWFFLQGRGVGAGLKEWDVTDTHKCTHHFFFGRRKVIIQFFLSSYCDKTSSRSKGYEIEFALWWNWEIYHQKLKKLQCSKEIWKGQFNKSVARKGKMQLWVAEIQSNLSVGDERWKNAVVSDPARFPSEGGGKLKIK